MHFRRHLQKGWDLFLVNHSLRIYSLISYNILKIGKIGNNYVMCNIRETLNKHEKLKSYKIQKIHYVIQSYSNNAER